MRPTKRVDANQKDFILQKMGCNYKDAEILRMLKEKFGLTLNPSTVLRYRQNPDYQTKINRFRKEFESHVVDVELASKRRRVEELNWIYYEFKKKEQYEKAMRSLAQIQSELEFKDSASPTYQFNQYINMTNDEIRTKLMENAKKLLELENRSAPVEVTAEAQTVEVEN